MLLDDDSSPDASSPSSSGLASPVRLHCDAGASAARQILPSEPTSYAGLQDDISDQHACTDTKLYMTGKVRLKDLHQNAGLLCGTDLASIPDIAWETGDLYIRMLNGSIVTRCIPIYSTRSAAQLTNKSPLAN